MTPSLHLFSHFGTRPVTIKKRLISYFNELLLKYKQYDLNKNLNIIKNHVILDSIMSAFYGLKPANNSDTHHICVVYFNAVVNWLL